MEEQNSREERLKSFVRPTEEAGDKFYCRWTHNLSEFIKDTRTSDAKLDYANTTLTDMFAKLEEMTLEDFPPTHQLSSEDGPCMPGDCGIYSPRKKK